jgi:CBS domain-containing protein
MLRVLDAMSPELPVLGANDPLTGVAAAMARLGLEEVAVVIGSRLVGVVSRSDVLGAPTHRKALHRMRPPAAPLAPDAPLDDAYRRMAREHRTLLYVCDPAGHLVGCLLGAGTGTRTTPNIADISGL